MKVYAFVPDKGFSERVKNKNSKYLDGEMLYEHALKLLLKCKNIDKVFLDTEEPKMFEKINYLPIHFMHRETSLASNKTDGHQLFYNEVKNNDDADIYIQLLCTSPFINPITIDNAIEQLKMNDCYDSAILMKKEKVYQWHENSPLYDVNHIPNSKNLPDTITETMGLYILKRDVALSTKKRIGMNPLFIYSTPLEAIDVNYPEDFDLAEIIANGIKQEEVNKLNILKNCLTSTILSDLLDDLLNNTGKEYGGIIKGITANIGNSKLFGRAKTLHIRKLKEGEDYKGIYKALDSYASIANNDIIVVQNDLKNFAYFGDLNTRLAQRTGASGVITNSLTRDQEKVNILSFPVFSAGYTCADVKRRGTVESINNKININSINIEPGDLIFADSDGIIMIKREYVEFVINKALKVLETETRIVKDIYKGDSTSSLINKYGCF